MTKIYHIQITRDVYSEIYKGLFEVLEQLFPIKFILEEQNEFEVDGIIMSDDIDNKDKSIVPSLALVRHLNLLTKPKKIEAEIDFVNNPSVPFPFLGRKIYTKFSKIGSYLLVRNNEKILANVGLEGPIWSVLQVGVTKHFRSALPLPLITREQNFNDLFNGECFLEMLILLQFIREISSSSEYQHAPLRASFIIDDPNLHWPKYGFVDYRGIVESAKKENYHVSFATIPLDTWVTHSETADIFRTHTKWISLLIHGNNHAKNELSLNYSEVMLGNLIQQVLWRIKRFENKTALSVSRVMVPPHGACSDNMLAELSNSEFEAACISSGSLRFHNQSKPWTKTLGFLPSENIHGCPVLPRWGLTGNVKNSLLIAAYLGQPMILRGHQQDFKDGGKLFDEYARFINGLGNVFWSSMTDLSRLNYVWRKEGGICRIKIFGKKIVFQLPVGVSEVIIECPPCMNNRSWQLVSADGNVNQVMSGESFLFSDEMDNEIHLERNDVTELISKNGVSNCTSLRLILRRLLSEARDRLMWS